MIELNRSKEELMARAREVIDREATAIQSLLGQMDGSLYDIVRLLANCMGHVLVTGAGTSRFVAERFAHLLCCCGTPALFIHASDSLHGGAGAVMPNDLVFIISKGGQSIEINQFARIAKSRGAKIIALTEKPASPLGEISDVIYSIAVEGEIDPYGMIATGSSLTNCAACDVLCILLLEAKGYTQSQFGETHPSGTVGIRLKRESC